MFRVRLSAVSPLALPAVIWFLLAGLRSRCSPNSLAETCRERQAGISNGRHHRQVSSTTDNPDNTTQQKRHIETLAQYCFNVSYLMGIVLV